MAEALGTVQQYIDASRRLLQDQIEPYRYPNVDIVEALNEGLMEARRLRADLFLSSNFTPGYHVVGTLTAPVVMDPMYRNSLVYYIVGKMQLRDDEATTDSRAAAFTQKFIAQMLTIAS